MQYRTSARGILRENDKILFIEYKDERGNFYYSLPGGGQEKGMSLSETLKSEFREEVGIEVEAGDIVLVREFILNKPDVEIWKEGIHQVEIIFDCRRIDSLKDQNYTIQPDQGMVGMKWISINDMDKFRIYPCQELSNKILNRGVSYLFNRD